MPHRFPETAGNAVDLPLQLCVFRTKDAYRKDLNKLSQTSKFNSYHLLAKSSKDVKAGQYMLDTS